MTRTVKVIHLDTHRCAPKLDTLEIKDFKISLVNSVEKINPGDLVLLCFTHTARMSANVDFNRVAPIVEKVVNAENVALLGLAPNNKADGVPTHYGIGPGNNTDKYKLRCFQVAFSPQTKDWINNENKVSLSDMAEWCNERCPAVEDEQHPAPDNKDQRPAGPATLYSTLDKFYQNHKILYHLAFAAVVLVAAACVSRIGVAAGIINQMLNSSSSGLSR